MVQRAKESFLKRIEEEFIRTTDTLWENEVQANLFVARVLFGTAILDLIFMALAYFKVLDVAEGVISGVLFQSFLELIIPSIICFALKGKKKWLKILMLVEYCVVLARVIMILNHNVVLLMVFPVVLSVRYYSRPVTSFVAAFSIFLVGLVSYLGIVYKMTRIDMNMVELPAGTVLNFTEFSTLRKVVEAQGNIDVNRLAIHAMQNSFLPRFIMFSMVAIMCSEIARKGRSAIFAQQAETQKSERISTELNLASDIQANMLPNIFPAFPSRNDFDIYASMTPAKEVGGDFYDFFMVDDDHLAMVMADVSGKGIPAAMFMVIAKTLIKDHTQLGLQPDEVFTRVNEILCEGNEAGLFVTAWMGILDLNTGKLTYANAGHNPPVVKLGNEVKYLHSKPGFVLAGFEGFKYSKFDLQLQRGDKLFLYTDGATEATNLNNELYGEDRLIECLRNQEGRTCADALHAVRADIDKFVGEAEQFDDLTLLAFDYSPKDKEKNNVERTYDATDENLRTVIAFVEEELEKNGAGMKDIMTITVAVEEIFVNICHYAYPNRVGKATVGMNFDEHDVSIYFIDSGIPFDPLAKPDPNVNAKLEDRSIGGLGIYMVKKSMDECSYERRNNENYFVMRKAIK